MSSQKHEKRLRKVSCAFLLGLFCLNGGVVTAVPHVAGTLLAQQQERTINGIVLDETGEPVIGASIKMDGTGVGAVSDVDGKFAITIKGEGNLLVSYLGYQSQTIATAGKSDFRVVLQPGDNSLDEVVVTALGIKREKKALGYAMQEVKTDGLTENKNFSVANMLQGKVAGVQIAQSGTGLGGSTRIIMRGLNSLSGNNQPLWVVDGMPISDNSVGQADQWGGSDYSGAAAEINPEDIESISILKGANAAALYGSRAQSGAIVITTKKGRLNQPLRVEYNGTLSITNAYSPYDYQNIYGQGSAGKYDIQSKMSWGPRMQGQTIDNWRNVFYGDTRYEPYALTPQKDYIKDFYETGVAYTNTLTATAGGDNLMGRFSFTDSRANDIVPNYKQNRQYFDLNTEFRSGFLTLGAKVNYMHEKTYNRPGQGEYGLMVQLVKMPRGIRLADLSSPRGIGNYIYNNVNWSGPSDNYANPYALTMDENGNRMDRNRLIGQVSASFRFTDYLHLTGRAGVDWFNDQIKNFNTLPDPTSSASQYVNNSLTNKEFNADLILYFDKTFGNFSINANAGASVMNRRNDGLAGYSGLFATPGVIGLANGLTQTVSEAYAKKEIQSLFFSASFGYRSFAYLDITGRNDWSSTLPKTNRSYFYPSVSASVILSEALKLSAWVTYWKVRGSWAQVGNDTDPYKLAELYYLWTSGDKLDASGDKVNPAIIKEYKSKVKALADLKPEKTNSAEIGTEAHFLDNRLSVDFTYYTTSTTNQILSVNMPGSSGYISKSINAGKIKSHGVELMLAATPVKIQDWQWDVSLNWGLNRTRCETLDPEISRFSLGGIRVGEVVVNEGGKFGDIVGNAYKRDANGNIVVDGNGLPEKESDKVIGNMLPNWTGSLGTTLRWRDLTFSALLDIRQGGKFISNTDNYACQQGTSAKTVYGRENGEQIVVEGVTADGQPNTKGVSAEAYWTNIAGPEGIAEAFLYSGSYVKMREMSVGYILPQAWFSRTPIKYVKLSLVGRDLFYLHKSAPVNPEGAFSRNDYAQAFELAAMPPTRSIGFSLNVKF